MWLVPHTQKRWLLFLCDSHRDVIADTHPLTAEDRVELQRRREAEQLALSGGPWVRPQPLS